MSFKIARPRECLSCGGMCYAYDMYETSTTGREYPEGVRKCYWRCQECGRKFQTMEREGDFVVVAQLPEASIAYLAFQ
jgi:hypothetical protein